MNTIDDLKNEEIENYTDLIDYYIDKCEHSNYDKQELETLHSTLVNIDRLLHSMDSESGRIPLMVLYENLVKSSNGLTIHIFEGIIECMISNNLIKPCQALICNTCNSIIVSFRKTPSAYELCNILYEKYMCDTCRHELDYRMPVSELEYIGVYYKV